MRQLMVMGIGEESGGDVALREEGKNDRDTGGKRSVPNRESCQWGERSIVPETVLNIGHAKDITASRPPPGVTGRGKAERRPQSAS